MDLDGVIGGGQIGYNCQRSNWVFGLEGDIQGSDQKGRTDTVCPGGPAVSTTTTAAAVNGTSVSGSFVTPIVAPSGAFLTTSYRSHITENIFRVGLNYKWGGPVVAKY